MTLRRQETAMRCAKAWGERVRLVDVPRAGHFMLLEQPEVVTQAVLGFLTEDEASSQ